VLVGLVGVGKGNLVAIAIVSKHNVQHRENKVLDVFVPFVGDEGEDGVDLVVDLLLTAVEGL